MSFALSGTPTPLTSVFGLDDRRETTRSPWRISFEAKKKKRSSFAALLLSTRTLSSSSLVHLSRLMFGFTRWRHRCAHCCPVRPGRNPATVDHLFPYFSCMRWSRASSSFVHGTCFGLPGVASAAWSTRDADAHVISKERPAMCTMTMMFFIKYNKKSARFSVVQRQPRGALPRKNATRTPPPSSKSSSPPPSAERTTTTKSRRASKSKTTKRKMS